MATSFSVRRSRSTRREPPTVGRQKSNYQYHHRSSVCNLQNVFQHGTIFIHKVDFIATSKMRGSKFGQYLIRTLLKSLRGCHGHDRMVVGFTTTYAISAYHYLSCEFKSSTDGVCLIQHYVIKFVSDLRQVVGFLRVLQFPPPIKLTAMI